VVGDRRQRLAAGPAIARAEPHPGRVARAVEGELGPHRDRSDPAFVRLRDEVLEILGVRRGAREIIFSV